MGNNQQFSFEPLEQFKEWHGIYNIIPGQTTKLTTLYYPDYGFWPTIRYYANNELINCPAMEEGDVGKLASAISRAKEFLTNTKGGSFIINEFGQVIVPSSDGDGRRLLIGECKGPLYFEGEDEIIDLSDDDGLVTGDSWERPYIGIKYQLHRDSYVYFWDGSVIEPPRQDKELIRKIRSVRRYGSASFIVNPYGLVLMKNPVRNFSFEDDQWGAVYVGRINYELWYEKEEF